MSHSDSEVKSDREKLRRSLHVELKRRKRIPPNFVKFFKTHCYPSLRELRLIEAVSVNNTELVEQLLKAGVSPNATDMENRGALHIAVSRDYVDMVALLLKYGADPNKRDVLHNTPLHLAACTYSFPIIKLLVKHGADSYSPDLQGRSPLQLAKSKMIIVKRCWDQGDIAVGQLITELKEMWDFVATIWNLSKHRKSPDFCCRVDTALGNLRKCLDEYKDEDDDTSNNISEDLTQILSGFQDIKIE